MTKKDTGEITEIRKLSDKDWTPKFSTNYNTSKVRDDWQVIPLKTLGNKSGVQHGRTNKSDKDSWYMSVRKVHHNVNDFDDVESLGSSTEYIHDDDVASSAVDDNGSSMLGSFASAMASYWV